MTHGSKEDEKTIRDIDSFFEELEAGMLVDAFFTQEEIQKYEECKKKKSTSSSLP